MLLPSTAKLLNVHFKARLQSETVANTFVFLNSQHTCKPVVLKVHTSLSLAEIAKLLNQKLKYQLKPFTQVEVNFSKD